MKRSFADHVREVVDCAHDGALAIGNSRAFLGLKIVALVFAAVVLAGATIAVWQSNFPVARIPGPDHIDRLVYLNQWPPADQKPDRPDDRHFFYYTPQGTSIRNLRYSWFRNLETPWSTELFASRENMEALGFIVDKVKDPKTGKDLYDFPVGFARGYDRKIRDEVVDITCAACHTGELHYTRPDKNGKPEHIAVRVDGGPAMHAFTSLNYGQFGPSLITSMAATYLNPFKFNRFAGRVLGERYDSGKSRLRQEFGGVLWTLLKQGASDKIHNRYPVEEGFGRTDAIGRISNEVFGHNLNEANYHVADAPVSYPPLWDIWKFRWVQYTASVSQPLARNLGESLGVGADPGLLDGYGGPVTEEARFITSSNFRNLVAIERDIRYLQPPTWPDDFPKISDDTWARGRSLYFLRCAHCHQPCDEPEEVRQTEVPGRNTGEALWGLATLKPEEIGTDPTAANNFYNVQVDLRDSGLDDDYARKLVEKNIRLRHERSDKYRKLHNLPVLPLEADLKQARDAVNVRSASIGAGLNYFGMMMSDHFYKEQDVVPATQAIMNGDDALDIPRVIRQYKARPLAGIWATAPFLHNGSVATLYELLLPASQRRPKFYVGDKEFDPKYVGIPFSQPAKKGFLFDTAIVGNLNIGHEFRAGYKEGQPPQYGVIGPELSNDERFAIIEYLKKMPETDYNGLSSCGYDRQ